MRDLSIKQIELLDEYFSGLISKSELIERMPSDLTFSEVEKLIDDYKLMQDVITWDAIKSNPELVSASNYVHKNKMSNWWLKGGVAFALVVGVSLAFILIKKMSNHEPVSDTHSESQGKEVVVTQEKEVIKKRKGIVEASLPAVPGSEVDSKEIEPSSPTLVDSTINAKLQEEEVVDVSDTLIEQVSSGIVKEDSAVMKAPLEESEEIVECQGGIVTRVVIEEEPCEGDANGKVTLKSSGGKLPYSYTIDEDEVRGAIDYLEEGEYVLITKDSFGCYAEQVFSVSEKECQQLMEDVYSVSISNNDVITLPSVNGEFTVISNGGVMVYSTMTEGQDWGVIDIQGRVLASGAYIFIFKGENELIKGEINVLR